MNDHIPTAVEVHMQPTLAHARRAGLERLQQDERARRVALQSAIGAAADALLRGNDLLPHLDDHERLSRLIAALGAVADTLVSNAGLCLPDALIALQAEALTFSEAIAREEAR